MTLRHLTLLQINDTHGYLEPHPELFWEADQARYETLGGYAKISGYFKQVRAERGADAVIALDNGDTLHGTFPAVHSKGEALIAPLNQLGLDAWTVHWDFVFGPERLSELAAKLNYPLLASNCYRQDTHEQPFPSSMLLERGGIRIGIIGIAAYIIDKTFPARVSEGLYFTLGKDELPEHIQRLREQGAELIVVLSHLGFPQDCQLAADIKGIDILLSGHTHNRLFQPVVINGTTLIQSGCHASFVGRLDITLTAGQAPVISHQLVPLDASVPTDPDMHALIEAIYAPHRSMLNEIVGESVSHLNRYTSLESTMDNVLLAAVARSAQTQIAFSNGWRYGAPIPAGSQVSVNDLWNILPTDPEIETVELTGREIWAMLEENLERTFSSNPYQQMGGFVKRCRGLQVYFKLENPLGARIQELFAEGSRLNPDKTYRVSFITEQGVPPKYGQNRRKTGIRALDALRLYFLQEQQVSTELSGSFVMV